MTAAYPPIAITGMGVITPIGNSVQAFEESLRSGRSGSGEITSFDTSHFPVKRACEVRGFDPKKFGTKIMDPFIQYAVAAADEAIHQAGLDLSVLDPYRTAISVSSSKGGVHTIDRFKERFTKRPSALLGARIYTNAVPNFAAQWIARRWKIKGPAKCYVAACATGTVAIAEGARMLQDGVADICIAGASDASIVPLMLAGYRQMKVLSKDEMRPFSKDRSGFLVGEGAGILILESEAFAKKRKAKILGKITGFGYGAASQNPLLFQEGDHGASDAIHRALLQAGTGKDEIDYVNLHGTATQHGDLYETGEMKYFFGARAKEIPMSSTKSQTGHLLGASGAVEAVATTLALAKGFLPPTLHLQKPDPQCDLDYVPNQARSQKSKTAISLSMGFGGHAACLVFQKGDAP